MGTDFHVGPDQTLASIGESPWATLVPGDRVFIHWQVDPYHEKWVINRQGTASQPIEIIGVLGPNGERPVISGDGAVTAPGLNYWNEERGVIKVGGSNTPSDGLPQHIVIENLEVRSAHPSYSFTNDNGQSAAYANNAASIYVEKAANLTIRNCELHDSGNGLFIGAYEGQTQHMLIEGNHIHSNGIDGSFYEHNSYTAAIDIIIQYNRYGPLRTGAGGNNLKDRSAGLVVRYNWIESGNRQLDLVDAEDSEVLVNHPSYQTTHVYGNVLIEPDGAGNSQILHYGGDSGTLDDYRKGDLYFYNNTVISTRTGNTTLVRLSTNDETALVFNNVIHTTATGNHLALIGGDGNFNYHHNWLSENHVPCHCSPGGSLNDQGNNLVGTNPMFVDPNALNFRPNSGSPLIDNGSALPSFLFSDYDLTNEYLEHQSSVPRAVDLELDIGAFEVGTSVGIWEDHPSEQISVQPNPTANFVTLRGNEGSCIDLVQVFELSGRMLLEQQGQRLDLSSFDTGIYLLKPHFSNGHIHSLRVVKL